MASKGNEKLNLINTGTQLPEGACVVIVKTEWNADIINALEAGAQKILEKCNVKNVVSITVPGAIEISHAIKIYWEANKYKDIKPSAFIALGCVIKGDTPHFDFVCQSVTSGITQLNLQLPVPTIYGILTVLNEEQAYERLGGSQGHKGEEAALTAVKMIVLSKEIKNHLV
ncbi:MAG: 6,7-dimethyl-8-ribityllumazine synthase [Chitinophagaceae bacterium]